MRASERLLALAVVLLGMAACGGETSQAEPRAAVAPAAGTATSMARPPYGVVADISYAGDLAELPDGAKVYLFLRAKGERMPLAVQYFDAAELPKRASFSTREPLTDVELVARLSLSGRVEKSAGDLEAQAWIENVGHPPQTRQMVLGGGTDAGPTAPIASARPLETAPRAVSIHALVTIDSKEGLPADAPVFVIARAAHNPMPLAVRRLTVAELPAEIELGDGDAMLFSHRLSLAKSFTVFARVSTLARTEASPGDPQSAPTELRADAVPEQVVLAIRR